MYLVVNTIASSYTDEHHRYIQNMYNLLVVRKTFIARLTTRERHQLTGTSSVTMCRVLVRVNNVQPTRVVNMSQNK